MTNKSLLFSFLLFSSLIFSQEDTLIPSAHLKSNYILEIQGGGSLDLFNLVPIDYFDYLELGYYSGVSFLKKNLRNFYVGGSFSVGRLQPYQFVEGKLKRYEIEYLWGKYFSIGLSVGDEFRFNKSSLFFQGTALYFGGFDPAIGFSAKIDYSYNFHKDFFVGISSELFVLTVYGLEQLHLGPVIKYRF